MKKLFLLTILCFVLSKVQAQKTESSVDLLMKAGYHGSSGTAMQLAGIGIVVASAFVNPSDESTRGVFMFVGGALSLGGLFCHLSGWQKIRKAAESMQKEKKVGMLIDDKGVGLALRF